MPGIAAALSNISSLQLPLGSMPAELQDQFPGLARDACRRAFSPGLNLVALELYMWVAPAVWAIVVALRSAQQGQFLAGVFVAP
eukprot:7863562-Lingulodinium_polyedra.AAC.1